MSSLRVEYTPLVSFCIFHSLPLSSHEGDSIPRRRRRQPRPTRPSRICFELLMFLVLLKVVDSDWRSHCTHTEFRENRVEYEEEEEKNAF